VYLEGSYASRKRGAEVVNEEIAKRLARDGHEVIFWLAGLKWRARGIVDGYKIVRLGIAGVCIGKRIAITATLRGWADL